MLMVAVNLSDKICTNLKKYENYSDEPLERIIDRVLKYVDEADDHLTEEELKGVETSREQIQNGECVTLEELLKKHDLQ